MNTAPTAKSSYIRSCHAFAKKRRSSGSDVHSVHSVHVFHGDARDRKAGYLLLETVVAMALLSIGMVAIHAGLQQAIIVRGQARDIAVARHILEQVISKAELQPRLVEAQGSGDGEGELNRFHWAWQIYKINLPDPPIPPNIPPEQQGMYRLRARYLPKVQATVNWSRSGRDFHETAQTFWYPSKLFVPKEQRDQ